MVGIVALCREEEQYTQWLSERQLAYTIVHDEAEAAGVAVMIFCGGPDWGKRPERDALDRRIYDYCVAHQIPMLGICRGMQEIAYFMGAALIEDVGELNAIHKAQTNGASRQHAILLSDGRQTMVNSRHHQAVKKFGRGFKATAYSPDGVVEAIENAEYPAIGVQFHPENLVSIKERKFKRGLQQRLELMSMINSVLREGFAWRAIDIIFTRNIPSNDTDIANMVNTLKDIVSEETLLAQIPFVDDVQSELEKLNG